MRKNRRLLASFCEIVIGAVLTVCGFIGWVDAYWSGMGSALVGVGFFFLMREIRYHTNTNYKENVEVELKDERNQYIRVKAWSWAGYFYVLIAAVCSIIFKLLENDLLSQAAGLSVCLIVVLYWVSYLVLKRKY